MKSLSVILTIMLFSILISGCFSNYLYPEPEYSNVKINSIKVTAMSFVDANSTGWDNWSGPDLYIVILDANNTQVYRSSTKWDCSASGLPYSWSLPTAFEINNLSSNYTISVYDDDSDDITSNDDLIGGYYFNFDSAKEGYPTAISIHNAAYPTKFELSVIWY